MTAKRDGDSLTVGGDRPFLLDADDVWRVESGRVDVFAVRVVDDQPHGPRTHVLRVEEGHALFGAARRADANGWGLLAVATNQTRLFREPQSGLDASEAAALAEPWIEVLYASMTRDKLPAVSVELAPGQEIDLEPGANLRARAEPIWLRPQSGVVRLMGRPGLELEADQWTPLARGAWLEAPAAVRVGAVDARDLPSEAMGAGLARLHDLVLRYARLTSEADEAASAARMKRKGAYRQAVLRDACERVASTMVRHPSAALVAPDGPVAVEDLEDPLFAAATLVGRALKLTIKSYPRSQGSRPPRDRLASILRASRVRWRRVALRGAWWREDNGPMLAYRTDGKRPVALLRPSTRGPYVMHDAADGTERAVDAAVAESLEPFACTFYRPFPERRLRVRDLLRFGLQGSGRDIALVVAMVLCGAVLGMVPPIATGMLFNTIIPSAQRSQLLQMTFVLVACAVTGALFSLAQAIALLRIEGRASAALQSGVWDRLLALPLPFFRPYTAGDMAVRAMSIDSMRQAISGSTITALMGVAMAAGNFGLMYWYSRELALWATVIIAAVLCVTVFGSYLQLRPQRESVRLQSKISGLVLQLLGSIAKLRVAAAEVHAFALWVRAFSDQRRLQYQSRSVGNWLAAFNGAIPVLSNLVLFSLALPLIAEDRSLPTGDFLAFLSAYSSCSGSIVASSLALLATINTIPVYEQAKPILETLPEIDVGKSDPGVLTGDIDVHHAMFRYHTDGPLVLRDVSFGIRPGQFVAFVGPSGSGKSTLLRLLLGFETLEAGAVYYDGQELGGLDVQAVRRQMGVVLQSGRLMSGEIFMNIVGSSVASLDEAWEAARMAGLADDIKAMPMGMHTMVSEGGSTLSGGQRQRLMIARAIVNRPRILLFDEATSALDNRTQSIVSRSLESLQATRIVVAHRLSTIVNADRIFVVDKGRLVQTGTYSELMTQEGPFAELAKRQIA
jgi:NHLM bacteriocin system ABC transporter ATP-binding protein